MDTAVPDEFHGDETLLTSHETLAVSLLVMSAKMMVFNVMKSFMKLLLRLVLPYLHQGSCRRRRPRPPAVAVLT